MDPAYISAIAALSGSVIGGFTSLAASWLSQSAQARVQQQLKDKERRQELYRTFIERASKLYADALVNDKPYILDLVDLFAMSSQMRILSTTGVADKAEEVARLITDTYFEPNKTLVDVRNAMDRGELNPLLRFSRVAREELGDGH